MRVISTAVQAGTCKVGQLRECQRYLQTQMGTIDQGRAFTEKFDQVCSQNNQFLCVKVIVRGDLDDEMKEQLSERGPTAAAYTVKLDDENYIFILAAKPAPKGKTKAAVTPTTKTSVQPNGAAPSPPAMGN
jgi:hypothetical protein